MPLFSDSSCQSSSAQSLTAGLVDGLSRSTYETATKSHPFLVSAAAGTLSTALLSLWLSQDRIYASQAYPRFIGALIARIPFGVAGRGPRGGDADDKDRDARLEELRMRVLKALVFSLENIVREVEFFETTAQRLGLDSNRWSERKATRDYTAEMARMGTSNEGYACELGVEEGLLFLWAMEKVYLDAWTNVHKALSTEPNASSDVQAKNREDSYPVLPFAKNWSTEEFKKFVHDLAQLVDDVYVFGGLDKDDTALRRAQSVWERVCELEVGFWPEEKEVASVAQK